MSRLLYIQTSPRGERSYSNRVGDAFARAYRKSHSTDEVVAVNLFEKDMPPFDGPTVQAKYTIMHGKEHTEKELAIWKKVEAVIEEFLAADKYLVASPMWNYSIPYQLKLYVDILVQPGYTFSFSPAEGYQGLVTEKPLCLVLSRGGAYTGNSDAEALDMQKRYLETIFGFIGFTDIRSILVEPTLAGGPDAAEETLKAAVQQANEWAVGY
jgi:FMN-dependent NADH-azoreductase